MSETATVFARDLQDLLASPFDVVTQTEATARPGDISLSLSPEDGELGAEGYEFDVDQSIRISAPTADGVFYGTRTVLQLLKQHHDITFGRARDWPKYRERGLLIDIARRYFSPDWFEQRIREMAYLKMNYLHLHISDNEGFGIESTHVKRGTNERYLTKVEMSRLVEFARNYHVMIVPEIDMPGHMGGLLRDKPGYQLADVFGLRSGKVLDVTNEQAVHFAMDVIDEFIDCFPGEYWHTGADEVLPALAYPYYPILAASLNKDRADKSANNKDAIHDFVNKVDVHVRDHRKRTRVWNDDLGGGATVTLDGRIVVDWWTDVAILSDWQTPTPQSLLHDGHEIMNSGWWPTYLVPGRFPIPPRPDMADAYLKWNVGDFYGIVYLNSTLQRPPQTVTAGDPRNRGAKLSVWNDDPDAESIEALTLEISERLKVLAQKTWGSELVVPSYGEFLSLGDAVGDAPGNAPPRGGH